jgi:glutamine amidotransferase
VSLIIIDTGCANLSSVAFAFGRLGVESEITAVASRIEQAERVVLPGVGSAPYAMQKIRDRNLVPVVRGLKQPVLGICLGMQLLFETLEEGDQKVEGFGVVKGHVGALDTQNNPSPHMGWNTLSTVKEDPLLKGINEGEYAYFVHSFAALVGDYTLMKCDYGGSFSAIIRQSNFRGCQFHPERSSATGSRILKNFLDLPA